MLLRSLLILALGALHGLRLNRKNSKPRKKTVGFGDVTLDEDGELHQKGAVAAVESAPHRPVVSDDTKFIFDWVDLFLQSRFSKTERGQEVIAAAVNGSAEKLLPSRAKIRVRLISGAAGKTMDFGTRTEWSDLDIWMSDISALKDGGWILANGFEPKNNLQIDPAWAGKGGAQGHAWDEFNTYAHLWTNAIPSRVRSFREFKEIDAWEPPAEEAKIITDFLFTYWEDREPIALVGWRSRKQLKSNIFSLAIDGPSAQLAFKVAMLSGARQSGINFTSDDPYRVTTSGKQGWGGSSGMQVNGDIHVEKMTVSRAMFKCIQTPGCAKIAYDGQEGSGAEETIHFQGGQEVKRVGNGFTYYMQPADPLRFKVTDTFDIAYVFSMLVQTPGGIELYNTYVSHVLDCAEANAQRRPALWVTRREVLDAAERERKNRKFNPHEPGKPSLAHWMKLHLSNRRLWFVEIGAQGKMHHIRPDLLFNLFVNEAALKLMGIPDEFHDVVLKYSFGENLQIVERRQAQQNLVFWTHEDDRFAIKRADLLEMKDSSNKQFQEVPLVV